MSGEGRVDRVNNPFRILIIMAAVTAIAFAAAFVYIVFVHTAGNSGQSLGNYSLVDPV